jgi:polysaccharide export outer membrane protein
MVFATVPGVLGCVYGKRLWLVPFLLWGIQAAYCQEKLETPQQTNEKIQQLAAAARSQPVNRTLGSGDLLHVDVFDVPDLSRDARIDESGDISFPLIPGKIRVGELTAFQVEQKLANLLLENGLVSHPQVSVFVKEQNSQPISLVGSVQKPMVYQESRRTTLLELLAQGGGLSPDAGSVVIITRPAPPREASGQTPGGADTGSVASGSQTITIELKDLLRSGDPAFNILVHGGDVVTVPRAGIVYVAGAVTQPGGYVLQDMGERLTILQALALAHGVLSTAKPDEAVIIRKDPTSGQKQEINVHLKKIMARKSEDVLLSANDILFVPDSTGKKVLRRTGDVMLGITEGLVLLRAGR